MFGKEDEIEPNFDEKNTLIVWAEVVKDPLK